MNWILWRVLISRLWGDACASELRFVAKSPKRLKGQFSLTPMSSPILVFPKESRFTAATDRKSLLALRSVGPTTK